jgi:hypothetical protein
MQLGSLKPGYVYFFTKNNQTNPVSKYLLQIIIRLPTGSTLLLQSLALRDKIDSHMRTNTIKGKYSIRTFHALHRPDSPPAYRLDRLGCSWVTAELPRLLPEDAGWTCGELSSTRPVAGTSARALFKHGIAEAALKSGEDA